MENSRSPRRSAEKWEAQLGRDLRALRLRRNRSQVDVAREANVSEDALRALEQGQGSRVRTLVQVARALGREEWLEAVLPPEPAVSPIAMVRARERESRSTRVRASRQPDRPGS